MPNLRIPYAFTNTKLPVPPQVAEKGQHFSCPICDDEVVLKHGDIRQPHFAHKPDTGCSGEGVLHKTAKQMICLMYNSDFGRVSVFRRCPNCRRTYESPFFKYYGIRAETEFTFGSYRVDVACFKDEKPLAIIEVRDTHAVDKEKWDYFKQQNLPCIEVEAKEVIRSWQEELIYTQMHADEETPKRMPGFSRKIRVITPSQIFLKAIKNNLFLFGDRLPRIFCPECNKDTVH